MANSPTSDVHKWPTVKEFVDPRGQYIPKWNVIFIVSCVFAVLLDPLFLYIPIINEDIKCLRLDNNLKIAALVLRSVTDLCYLLNIFFQVHQLISFSRNIDKTMRLYILIDILAVLPIPQIIILISMRGSRSFGTRKFMNLFVLVQYVPRVFRIYLSCKKSKLYSQEEIPIWVKGAINFFLYILASHVIGAFWYFFAIQQITICWQYACLLENGCVPNNLYCHDHHALRNIQFYELCSVDPPNEKFFNFGIFLDIIQLGILGSTDYSEKFSNCFWWGLRNLSSFGSNLKPSVNAWENLFAAFISIIGLLLFLYLIGNLQTYMQLDTTRLETHRWNMRIEKKMKEKGREVEQWLSKNGIPTRKKCDIMLKIEEELNEKKEVNVENILFILPSDVKSDMENCMPLKRLKQVRLLQNMDENVLKEFSEYLEPKKYTKNNDNIIIREKEPLQMMIFIVEGCLIIEMRNCSLTLELRAGGVYGEKLLSWQTWTSFPDLPLATESVRADSDVEALVLMASNIQHVRQKFKSSYFFSEENTRLTDNECDDLLESDSGPMLRKVPKLGSMNNRVLNAISENLKPMRCEGNTFKPMRYEGNTFTITEGKLLRMMVFVTRGSLSLKHGDRTYENRDEGGFYGEELLDWVLDRSFPAIVPISTHSVSGDNVDVLVLTAKDLSDVVSKFQSDFRKDIINPTDSSLDLCATVGLTWLKNKPSIFQHMDEEVLKEISKQLKLKSYSMDTYILRENNPLEYMFFFVDGSSMSIESTGRRPFKRGLNIGDFYGEELVYWVTHWASHTPFPDKLPLSTSNVKVGIDDTGNAGVLVLKLCADDLKSIVSNFRSQFIKQTNLQVDSERKQSNVDLLATLKVLRKKDMEKKDLETLCGSLILMKYNDMSSINEVELDKMFFITSGLVSVRSIKDDEKVYYHNSRYYCGDKLLKWALHPSRVYNHRLPKSDVWVEAVGEVEALVLSAIDLISWVSDFKWKGKTAQSRTSSNEGPHVSQRGQAMKAAITSDIDDNIVDEKKKE